MKKKHIEQLEGMKLESRSQWGDVFHRLLKNRLAMVGLGVVILMIVLSLLASVICRYDPYEAVFEERYQFFSARHLLGTDNFGRDLLTRLLYGGRTSLLIAVMALAISMVIGVILGGFAGYFGGTVDIILMRILDIIMAIPTLLLSICISTMLGAGILNTALAISLGGVPGMARITRAQILTVRDEQFVEAAVATGSSRLRTLFKHVLPNCLAPMIVNTSMGIGNNIMAISGLAFIGLGVASPTAEWGAIMNSGRECLQTFWPLAIMPGICIMITLFGFNVLGDGLRDAMDPKLKQ